jgi:hypothetical protein
VRGVYRRARPTSPAEWRIPTVVLIRKPKDAVPTFALRDPISVDQALRYYLSFYETVEEYRDAYVLGLFEEITEDFGGVIRRINDRIGTTFSPFTHDERNVDGVLARIEENSRRRFGEASLEDKVSRPFAAREKLKRDVGYELEDPKRRDLISRAETVYERLTREPAPDR